MAVLAGINVDSLTSAQKRELLFLLEEKRRLEAENKFYSYKAYAKQMEFHASTSRETMLMAANQIGKCATHRSYLDLPDGTRATFRELYERATPFTVWAWDRGRRVLATAVMPIKKPPEPCVRLWFSDGTWFECALRHRVLSSSGDYTFVQNLLQTNSVDGPSVPSEGVSHLTGRFRGFLFGCLAGLRFCDAQLHSVGGAVRRVLQQQVDVRRYDSALCGSGVCLSTHTSIYRQALALLSSQGGEGRFWGRIVASVCQAAYRFSQRMSERIRGVQRRVLGLIVRLQSNDEGVQDQVLQGAWSSPGSEGNRIIAHELIPSQEVYDFTVPVYENYITNGIVHHNTYAHAYHITAHMTGRYPEWWTGRRFNTATMGWIAGVTGTGVRDTLQRLLVGRPGAFGTGMIPKALLKDTTPSRGVPDLLDSFQVQHIGGGISTAGVKSYEQGREKFQGETLDWAALDEEPPLDVYTEILTRTNTTMGPITMTFTPLLGMSDVVRRYVVEKVPGTRVVMATIDDAEHYTPEQREAIVAAYPEHERDARAKGIPMLGSGLIFPIAESEIKVAPFDIPAHWPRLCAIDFGYDHPFAAVWLAWDRDSDTVYVYDCYREKNSLPALHAASIIPRGRWIPIVWPADGLGTEKGTGIALKQQYVAAQLNMLDRPFKRADGTVSVEAGLMDMLQSMRTRRFKVFSHLNDWFEEFRMYHRKDGKIVKVNDDLMDATRYGFDMRREAKLEIEMAPQMGLQPRIFAPAPVWTTFDPVTGY